MVRTVPIGVGATGEFLAELGEKLGLDWALVGEADRRSRLPWYSRSVDSTYLTGKRVFVFGDATHAIAAARIASSELGFNVVGLGSYSREFAPLINNADCVNEALAAAREALGGDNVVEAKAPITASEDFAQYLTRAPGCFAFLGAGLDRPPLHNPTYDFNDAILPDGVRFFEAIVRRRLPGAAAGR